MGTKRTNRVVIVLSDDELHIIDRIADEMGLSVSNWIRVKLLEMARQAGQQVRTQAYNDPRDTFRT